MCRQQEPQLIIARLDAPRLTDVQMEMLRRHWQAGVAAIVGLDDVSTGVFRACFLGTVRLESGQPLTSHQQLELQKLLQDMLELVHGTDAQLQVAGGDLQQCSRGKDCPRHCLKNSDCILSAQTPAFHLLTILVAHHQLMGPTWQDLAGSLLASGKISSTVCCCSLTVICWFCCSRAGACADCHCICLVWSRA